MSSDDLTMADLTAEEKEIIQRLRNENKEKQTAIVASLESFKLWLKDNLPKIWEKIRQIGEPVATQILTQILISAIKNAFGLPF